MRLSKQRGENKQQRSPKRQRGDFAHPSRGNRGQQRGNEASRPRFGGLLVAAAALVAALAAALTAPAAIGASSRPPVSSYASLPKIRSISLAPDGSSLLMLRAYGETYQAVAMDPATGRSWLVMAAKPGEFLFNWCAYANPTRIVCSIRFYDTLRAEQVDARSIRRYRDGRTTFTRLVAADIDGANSLQLRAPGARDGKLIWNPPDQDDIISWLPDDPEHVLIQLAREDRIHPSVYRLNVYNSRLKRLRRFDERVSSWLADRGGALRLAVGFDAALEPLAFRVDRRSLTPLDTGVLDGVASPAPAGVSADGRHALAYSYLNGERRQLVEVDLADPGKPRTLVADPAFDVFGSIFRDPRTHQPLAVHYERDTLTTRWLDAAAQARFAPVARALEEKHSRVRPLSASNDLGMMAIRAEGRGSRPTYYLYDEKQQALKRIARNYEDIPIVVEPTALRYPTRDGYEIPAYLYTPAGDGPHPTVLLPHGGPNARDTDSFDYWAQLLVSRGYAVLKPNFRGSVGYGAAHLSAGFQQWGLRMQDDVIDGLDHLVAEGIADPQRVCVVGGSYGGYVALVAAFKTPERFRCAVSFAGVTDLPELKARWRTFDLGALSLARVQSGRAVTENSPLHQVSRIGVPLLVVHGDVDRSVMIEQSRRFVAALEREGKAHRYIEQADGDHFLSLQSHRLEFLEALDRFLAEHLTDSEAAPGN